MYIKLLLSKVFNAVISKTKNDNNYINNICYYFVILNFVDYNVLNVPVFIINNLIKLILIIFQYFDLETL